MRNAKTLLACGIAACLISAIALPAAALAQGGSQGGYPPGPPGMAPPPPSSFLTAPGTVVPTDQASYDDEDVVHNDPVPVPDMPPPSERMGLNPVTTVNSDPADLPPTPVLASSYNDSQTVNDGPAMNDSPPINASMNASMNAPGSSAAPMPAYDVDVGHMDGGANGGDAHVDNDAPMDNDAYTDNPGANTLTPPVSDMTTDTPASTAPAPITAMNAETPHTSHALCPADEAGLFDVHGCLQKAEADAETKLNAAETRELRVARSGSDWKEGRTQAQLLSVSAMSFNAYRDLECLRQQVAGGGDHEKTGDIMLACQVRLNLARAAMLDGEHPGAAFHPTVQPQPVQMAYTAPGEAPVPLTPAPPTPMNAQPPSEP